MNHETEGHTLKYKILPPLLTGSNAKCPIIQNPPSLKQERRTLWFTVLSRLTGLYQLVCRFSLHFLILIPAVVIYANSISS